MNGKRISCLFGAILLLAACQAQPPDVAATVAVEVAQVVAATLTAVPTNTLQPTQRPYNTATPYATASPYPTEPLPETAVPYPTHTPYPEDLPTETAVATQTSAPAATSVSNSLAATAVPPSSVLGRAEMLNLLNQAHTALGQLTGIIDTATIDEKDVVCTEIVLAYDAFVATSAVNSANSSLPVKNAHGALQAAVSQMQEMNAIVEDCRLKVLQDPNSTIQYTAWSYFRARLGTVRNNLAQAINELTYAPEN
jgi:hypothetical protein